MSDAAEILPLTAPGSGGGVASGASEGQEEDERFRYGAPERRQSDYVKEYTERALGCLFLAFAVLLTAAVLLSLQTFCMTPEERARMMARYEIRFPDEKNNLNNEIAAIPSSSKGSAGNGVTAKENKPTVDTGASSNKPSAKTSASDKYDAVNHVENEKGTQAQLHSDSGSNSKEGTVTSKDGAAASSNTNHISTSSGGAGSSSNLNQWQPGVGSGPQSGGSAVDKKGSKSSESSSSSSKASSPDSSTDTHTTNGNKTPPSSSSSFDSKETAVTVKDGSTSSIPSPQQTMSVAQAIIAPQKTFETQVEKVSKSVSNDGKSSGKDGNGNGSTGVPASSEPPASKSVDGNKLTERPQ